MKKALLAMLAAALAGCAGAPPQKDAAMEYYRPQQRGDAANPWGYMDNRLREGTYFVASTYWNTVTAVAMFDRRAGELCGREGFQEFTYSREMIYAVAVSPAAVVPQGQKPQGARAEGVTREAIVACTKKAG